MMITRSSILSRVVRTVDIPIKEEDYISWCNGTSIQDAAPYLSESDREFMISGITDDEWDEMNNRFDEDE